MTHPNAFKALRNRISKTVLANYSHVVAAASLLAGTLLCTVISPATYAADNWFCWDYEVSETGVKSSRGFDYQSTGAPIPTGDSGSFNLVVYNVDGFPNCLGGSKNSKFKSLLARLEQEDFNIVLMQEMFTAKKHSFLRDESRLSKGNYPYRSKHWRGNMITYGHGLLRLSDFPFDMANTNDNDYTLATHEYELYDDCGGVDCLTEKGFTVAVHEITPAFKIHIYNTHMDAGSQETDIKAKADQFDQLADFINAYSQGATIILGGDFNAKWTREGYQTIWANFLSTTGLRLACQDLINSGDDSFMNCDHQYKDDTDQILYRNIDQNFELILSEYKELNFNGLSDHEPYIAQFTWSKK